MQPKQEQMLRRLIGDQTENIPAALGFCLQLRQLKRSLCLYCAKSQLRGKSRMSSVSTCSQEQAPVSQVWCKLFASLSTGCTSLSLFLLSSLYPSTVYNRQPSHPCKHLISPIRGTSRGQQGLPSQIPTQGGSRLARSACTPKHNLCQLDNYGLVPFSLQTLSLTLSL